MRRIFLTAWTIWLFDFATKQWALASFDESPRKVLGDFLSFTLIRNPGAAFSFATGFTIAFALLSLAVVIAVTYEATLFVSDQPIRAFGNEPLLHTLQIGRIKHTSGFGTVDRPCVLCSRL